MVRGLALVHPNSGAVLFASGCLASLSDNEADQFHRVFEAQDATSFRVCGRSFYPFEKTDCMCCCASTGRKFGLIVSNLHVVGVLLSVYALPCLPQHVIPVVDAFCNRIRG
jgi:hypothetical protein